MELTSQNDGHAEILWLELSIDIFKITIFPTGLRSQARLLPIHMITTPFPINSMKDQLDFKLYFFFSHVKKDSYFNSLGTYFYYELFLYTTTLQEQKKSNKKIPTVILLEPKFLCYLNVLYITKCLCYSNE